MMLLTSKRVGLRVHGHLSCRRQQGTATTKSIFPERAGGLLRESERAAGRERFSYRSALKISFKNWERKKETSKKSKERRSVARAMADLERRVSRALSVLDQASSAKDGILLDGAAAAVEASTSLCRPWNKADFLARLRCVRPRTLMHLTPPSCSLSPPPLLTVATEPFLRRRGLQSPTASTHLSAPASAGRIRRWILSFATIAGRN